MSFSERYSEVLSQHAEGAAFLWLSRRYATLAPHYSLPDLARLDARVEAHLDGLRIAGQKGWELCLEQLEVNEPGEVFAAGVLAFDSGKEDRIERVLDAAPLESELGPALVSALGWLSFDLLAPRIPSLLTSENADRRTLGLAACAAHRRDPGDPLRRLIRDEVPGVRARAIRAVGELGRTDLVDDASLGVSSEHSEVRFWSAWSTALLRGAAPALSLLKTVCLAPGPRQKQALDMVIRRSPGGEGKVFQAQMMQRPEQIPLALTGAGILGDPELIPWVIEKTRFLPLARKAGEAFTMITGADLAYRDLERKPPPEFEAGPTDDPDDENVAMDPDDNLPWPEPDVVQKWWDEHRRTFHNGTRYFLGKPMSVEWLKAVLRDGRQRQRAAAALELAMRDPGQVLFNVEAPGHRQIEWLGKPGAVIR